MWGLSFAGPLGLAAGMDKNVTVVRGHVRMGFSHVEVGTITPKAQPGNEKPRAWREIKLRAVRNRMGFNNKGAEVAARHLARLQEVPFGASTHHRGEHRKEQDDAIRSRRQ